MSNSSGNNNVVVDAMAYPPPKPTILESVVQIVKKSALLVVRYYVLGMLIVYSYLKKFFTRTIEPLEPVFEQVRKVPKKDVSAEGIFYQVLRLQFLVLLFVSPYIASAFHYLAQPLVWAKDWMFAAVDIDSSSYKKSE